MDEMVVAQNKYISSKRAARLSGYAQDYIGQLIRMGKLPATKVGRAWFVDELALLSFVNTSSKTTNSPAKDLARLATRVKDAAYVSKVSAGIEYPATWSPVRYEYDDAPLFPVSDSREGLVLHSRTRVVNSTGYSGGHVMGLSADIKMAKVRDISDKPVGSIVDGIRLSPDFSSTVVLDVVKSASVEPANTNITKSRTQTEVRGAPRTSQRFMVVVPLLLLALFLLPTLI